ncbi:MAG: LysR substrate-binding domain-containing protein [Pseudoclavibacter sp.]|nr:LysR substrate-binding domain-containing protein [Pseudoclavibacter sp.]
MLDVKRLRILRELQLRGTVAEVARTLGCSASAVSQQLGQLEQEAGAPLLRRQGRRLQLTPQAEILVEHTTAVLERLERAELDLAASLDRPVGEVRLAVFQSAALALVPDMLRLLAAAHPRLRIEVVQYEPEAALYNTAAGDFDLVAAEQYPGHAAPHHPGLDRELLTSDRLRLAVPADRELRGLADAAELPWVMEPPGSASRHWHEQLCRTAGFEPDVRFQTADLQAQLRLVETGNAVGIMNDLAWAHRTPRLRFLELPGRPRREIFTSARRSARDSALIRAVRDALRTVAEELSGIDMDARAAEAPSGGS